MSNGTRPRWQQTCLEHSTRDSRRCKRKEEQHYRTKARSWVDRAARQLRSVCHEQPHLFESTLCIGCQLANKNLQRIIGYIDQALSLKRSVLCSKWQKLKRHEPIVAMPKICPRPHDLRPSVVEIIGKEGGFHHRCTLESRDDRSRS